MSEAAQLNRDQVKDYLKNLSLLDAAALVKELKRSLAYRPRRRWRWRRLPRRVARRLRW